VKYGQQLAETLENQGVADAVASVSPDRLSVTFTVEATAPDVAVATGVCTWRKVASELQVESWPVVRASAATYGVLADEHAASALPELMGVAEVGELMGVAEVAELLDVSRQRVSALHNEERLPRPLTKLASGPVWAADGIRKFLESWTRQPGRPASGSPIATTETAGGEA
jgi:hypothetical protein